MSRPFIRMGDRTTHGGTVITGDVTWTLYGKAVARVGDLTVCPKCRGTFAITSGADNMTIMGQAVARQGDKTACGATLIASQATAWWDNESSAGQGNSMADGALQLATKDVAQEAPTICLECLAKAAAAGSAMVIRS